MDRCVVEGDLDVAITSRGMYIYVSWILGYEKRYERAIFGNAIGAVWLFNYFDAATCCDFANLLAPFGFLVVYQAYFNYCRLM